MTAFSAAALSPYGHSQQGRWQAPGGQCRCGDPHVAAGGAPARAQGTCGNGSSAETERDGREAWLHKPLGQPILVPLAGLSEAAGWNGRDEQKSRSGG